MSGDSGPGTESWLSSARSVADGASLHWIGNVVLTVLVFGLELLLTRTLGAGVYGIYAYGKRIISSALMFLNFGTDVSITKYLSANHDDPTLQNQVLLLSYLTSLVISIVVATGLYVAAPTINAYTLEEPVFTKALRVFALVLPFDALTRISTNSFRGLEMPAHRTAIMIARPVLRLTAIGGALLLGYSLLGVAWAFAAAGVLLFLFAFSFVLTRTDLRPKWGDGPSGAQVKEFYNFSAPMTFSRAASLLYSRIDIFMVGIFLTSTHIGIYNVSLLMAMLVAMPLKGFNQLFPPVASRLYSEDDYETLESVYVTVTRWSISASIIVASGLLVYRAELLSIFGEEFVAGTTVVALVVGGELVNSTAGPANDVLTMTDHQYAVLVNHWTFGAVNLVLNYYFILEFGLIGAALATAMVLAALNMVRVVEVWYFEGLFAYSLALWKPLSAGAAAVAVMYAVRFSVDGLPSIFVGGAAGVAVYAGLLYLFGIEETDRQLASEYIDLVA